MPHPLRGILASLALSLFAGLQTPLLAHGPAVLVFTKTSGFVHDSIPVGVAAIQALGQQNDFAVTVTSDAATLVNQLPNHEVVVFLSTTGDVLTTPQQDALKAFIQGGKGFVGIHSAADTLHGSPWYLSLVGAEFTNHPAGTPTATVKILDKSHPITQGLPQRWVRADEWYNFKVSPRGKVHVLAVVDEKTYSGGTHGDDHPIIWCQDFEGGRSAYIGMGHSSSAFSEPAIRTLLLNTINWASGHSGGDNGATVNGNYERNVLATGLSESIAMDIDSQGRIYVIEKASGRLKRYTPATGLVTTLGSVSVHAAGEHGLLGIALSPDFDTTGYIYLYYAPSTTAAPSRLSRFTLGANGLANEQILFTVPVLRTDTPGVGASPFAHHQGGCLRFDANGNLLLSLGDNTDASQYSPRNPSQPIKDGRKSAPNTNDLRGKILRITPAIGSGPASHPNYTIPAGNLFPEGTANTRPEIYVMGCRNPFRFCLDPYTGWLYFGDVGPDAGSDSSAAFGGPAGHDEFNQIKAAANCGWPYSIGFNRAYLDANAQPWNPATIAADLTAYGITGLKQLPAPQQAWIAYTYSQNLGFSEFGPNNQNLGGRTAFAGDVYQWAPGKNFPRYFDGTLFLMEFSRDLVLEAKTDANGDLLELTRFIPNFTVDQPIDMKFGPDGAMYMLEFSTGTLAQIRYTASNLSPVAVAGASVNSGPAPLTVSFSSAGSLDPDNDTVTYNWSFGDNTPDSAAPNPQHTFTTPGIYNVQLTVTDPEGFFSRSTIVIAVGNYAPVVTMNTPAHGSFFDWGDDVAFRFQVTDIEDGSSLAGQIASADVQFEAALAHGDHWHNELVLNALSGTVHIARDGGHAFDADLGYLFDAYYTDRGAPGVGSIRSGVRVNLEPKVRMAQFNDGASGVAVAATLDPVGGGQDIVNIDPNDHIFFRNLNLTGITAIRARASAAGPGGSIVVRKGSPTGAVLCTIPVATTGGGSAYRDFTAPVSASSDTSDLYFTFTGTGSNLFRLNWLVFRGQGASVVAGRPRVSDIETSNSNSVRITFDQPMDRATLSNVANYSFNRGVTVTTAAPAPDQLSVLLQTSPLAPRAYYEIALGPIEDLAGDPVAPGSKATVLNLTATTPFFFGINCGGPAFTDSQGRNFIADSGTYYNSGTNTSGSASPIANTTDDTLYQSERWSSTEVRYNIPVANGRYRVEVKLAEIYFTDPSRRAFNVDIEGARAATNLDLVAVAGANTANDVIREVTVTDGQINVVAGKGDIENAKINAIAITKIADAIPANSLAKWLKDHPAVAFDPASDHNADSLPALLHYALGSDPGSTLPATLPVVDSSGEETTLTFTRPTNLPDVKYAVEASSDMRTWLPLNVSPTLMPPSGGREQVRYDALTTAAQAAGLPTTKKTFFRLRVETKDL